MSDFGVLCLGLGKAFSDRTAQIQLSLILEMVSALKKEPSCIEAFDPVWDEGDKKVLSACGISIIKENLVSLLSRSIGHQLTNQFRRGNITSTPTDHIYSTCLTVQGRCTNHFFKPISQGRD